MEVNGIFYESMAIGHHYRSKKSLALAYLMTIGSKALVLTEPGEGESTSPVAQVSVQKSFDDEAAIQRKIIHEEQVQAFQRSLDDKPGVPVLKKGRNGEFRQIYIRVKDDPKKGKAVVWSSRMGGKKTFVLDDGMSVNILKPTSQVAPPNSNSGTSSHNNSSHSLFSSSSHGSNSTGDSGGGNNSRHLPHGFQPNVPVLCFNNNSRKLVIQFMTANEALVCVHLLRNLGVKDPNVSNIPGLDTN